jgi:hypothetical protein
VANNISNILLVVNRLVIQEVATVQACVAV